MAITTTDRHMISFVYDDAEVKAGKKADVILAHGYTADKNEFGDLFVRAAGVFKARGFNVIRFDFRGHGRSTIPQEEMTIAGQIKDLEAVSSYLWERNRLPQFIVGTSLGAVSTATVAAKRQRSPVGGVVFWNPVIDVAKTFIEPGTDWSRGSINEQSLAEIDAGRPFIMFEGYKLGRCVINEMRRTDTTPTLLSLTIPVLAFHGTEDVLVPCKYLATAAEISNRIDFRPLEGAGHGFLEQQDGVVVESANWVRKVVDSIA